MSKSITFPYSANDITELIKKDLGSLVSEHNILKGRVIARDIIKRERNIEVNDICYIEINVSI